MNCYFGCTWLTVSACSGVILKCPLGALVRLRLFQWLCSLMSSRSPWSDVLIRISRSLSLRCCTAAAPQDGRNGSTAGNKFHWVSHVCDTASAGVHRIGKIIKTTIIRNGSFIYVYHFFILPLILWKSYSWNIKVEKTLPENLCFGWNLPFWVSRRRVATSPWLPQTNDECDSLPLSLATDVIFPNSSGERYPFGDLASSVISPFFADWDNLTRQMESPHPCKKIKICQIYALPF